MTDTDRALVNLAELNARGVDDATINLWLDHPLFAIRDIAIVELRRRNIERSASLVLIHADGGLALVKHLDPA